MTILSAGGELSSESRDRIARMLGNWLVQVWSKLPQAFQQEIFEAAVHLEGGEVRADIAVFSMKGTPALLALCKSAPRPSQTVLVASD